MLGFPLGILSAAGADGVFSPASLNPILWLDAADASTITHSSGAVSQWNNKGTLGNFTQASGALQPTTNASTLNGKNVINFAADYLVGVNQNEWKPLHDGTKYFVAVVVKPGVVANPNTLYCVFGNHNGNGNTIGSSFFYDDRSTLPRQDELHHVVAAGDASFFQSTNGSPDNGFPANTFSIMASQADPANALLTDRIKLFRNDLAEFARDNAQGSQAVSPSSSNPSNPLHIGAFGVASFALTGSIAEIIIVAGENATDTNRELVRDYLNEKWAVYA